MTTAIILEDKLSYDQAPPSRALYLTKELLKKGISTILIGQKSSNKDIVNLKEHIISVSCLTGGRVGKMLFRFQMVIEILRIMRKKKIKTAIIRGYWLGAFLLPFMKILVVKVIYDFHWYRYKEQLIEKRDMRAITTMLFEWFIMKYSDNIISISENVCEDIPGKYHNKTLLLPNGVDLDEFDIGEDDEILQTYNIPMNKKIVCYVGNAFSKAFVIKDVLDASKYLEKGTKVVIIGDIYGNEEAVQNNSNIIFTGMIPHKDVIKILKKISIGIVPLSKNVPLTRSTRKTLEYIAAGKPIIMSNVKTGRESFLKEGDNILLYELDNPEDLAEKIKLLLMNNELYNKLSVNNLRLSYNFSWSHMLKRSGLLNILSG